MKKILFFVILIASLFIINNLIRSIYNLWQKQDLLIKAKNEVVREKKMNEQLKQQLKVVENPEFVEEEARNKLLLSKSGEKIILIPTLTPTQPKVVSATPKDAPWVQWWKLFF